MFYQLSACECRYTVPCFWALQHFTHVSACRLSMNLEFQGSPNSISPKVVPRNAAFGEGLVPTPAQRICMQACKAWIGTGARDPVSPAGLSYGVRSTV